MSVREGSYRGEAEGLIFQLRVERRESGEIDRISGDVFGSNRRFLVSFVSSTVEENQILGVASGPMVFRGHHMLTTGHVSIDVDERGLGAFQIAVDLEGGHRDVFAGRLEWQGTFLRRLLIEIDGLEGTEPPGDYLSRTGARIDLVQAFERVGFDVEVVVDPFTGRGPTGPQSRGWTPAEIHAAMQQVRNDQPIDRLHAHVFVCSFMAGRDNRGVLGIMYDFGQDDLNQRPREGVAIFHDHPLISDPRVPEDVRRREFVYTAVHEIGHALNLLHSFDKASPSALSWMNYPDIFPLGHEAPSRHDGTREFWRQFPESFDADELVHLRHGSPREIEAGGFPFGVYEEGVSIPFGGTVDPRRAAPGSNPLRQAFDIELIVKPLKDQYELGEPVFVSVDVINRGNAAVKVPNALDPTEGYVRLRLRRPDGQLELYRPPMRLCKQAQLLRLRPGEQLPGHPGAPIFLNPSGLVFDQPGAYEISAELVGVNGAQVIYSRPQMCHVQIPDARLQRCVEDMAANRPGTECLYLRHPLNDLDAWHKLEDSLKKAGLDKRKRNTTWSYAQYVAGLGWMTPFAGMRERSEKPADLRRAAARMDGISTGGLPASVKKRVETVQDRVKKSRKKKLGYSGYGLAPIDTKNERRASVPPSGFFGGLGLDQPKKAPRSPRSPFVRVVNSLRGLLRFADVVSWNIEHLHSRPQKIPDVAELIRDFRCDFWALQEVDGESLEELVDTLNGSGSVRYDFFAMPGRGQQNGCVFRTDTTRVDLLDPGERFAREVATEKTDGSTVTRDVFFRDPMLAHVRVSHGDNVFDFRCANVHLKSTDSKLRDKGNSIRAAAASDLVDWISDDREQSGEIDYLILGDMNAETAQQGLGDFVEDAELSLLSVGMPERHGEDNAVTRVASRRLLDHIVVTADAVSLMPDQDEEEQIIIRSDRTLADFTSDFSDHVPVAVRFIIGEDDD